MRNVSFDLSADAAFPQYQFGGFEGEHNATVLTVILPQRMQAQGEAEYRFVFETAGKEEIFSAPMQWQEGRLSVTLPQQLMVAPELKVYVGCYAYEGENLVQLSKSGQMILKIQRPAAIEGSFTQNVACVPGLVIEDEILADSKNPVSGGAVFEALTAKMDQDFLVSFAQGGIAPGDKAQDDCPVSEKAVSKKLEEYLKKEEYEIDGDLDPKSQNPIQNRVLTARVANALKGHESAMGALRLDDVCPISHRMKISVFDLSGDAVEGETVFVCGKNLDPVMSPSGSAVYGTVENCAFLPKGRYTVSMDVSGAKSWRFLYTVFDKEGNRVTETDSAATHLKSLNEATGLYFNSGSGGYYLWGQNLAAGSDTIETDGDYYLGVSFAADGATASNAQVELGERATGYEPYRTPISYTTESDGRIEGVIVGGETLTLLARDKVTLCCDYNRDLNRALKDVAENCLSNDRILIPVLVKDFGMKEAFRIFAQANAQKDTLTGITGRFFEIAAETVSETYASQFYKFSTSNTPLGEKTQDNAGLVCLPSTNTVAGRDDYADLPLFACFDCNYTIDADTLEPEILAIRDVYGRFESAPENSLVGVLQMTGWVRRSTTATTKTVEYRSRKSEGFRPLPESVRARDNSVRPFVIHAKYAAGYNSAGRLSSISGVQPASSRSVAAGKSAISRNSQIALWRQWGRQYGGFGLCDIAFLQLMLEIKYATLASSQVMRGCRSYPANGETAALSESGVKRILLAQGQGESFVIGSSVSLGTSGARTNDACYSICDIAKVLSIDSVQVEGVNYDAITLETENAFDTQQGITCITTHPWRTGSTDAVQGNDGSPIDNESGKEPFKLQGIEVMLGSYEVLGDVICNSSSSGYYTIQTNRLATEIVSGSAGANPVALGTILKEGEASAKYIAELNWEENDQESYMLGKEFGASSTTGYCTSVYLVADNKSGMYEWLAFGHLDGGIKAGFAGADLHSATSTSAWNITARACGTGGNRGEYQM